MRYMYGSFTDEQWRLLYKQAYKNLAPGGWIEQLEPNITYLSDDKTLPADSILAKSAPMFYPLCEKTGKRIDTEETFKDRIEAAGFTNMHEKTYKIPIGDWVKNPVLKEAGQYHKAQLLEGFEGYSMFLLPISVNRHRGHQKRFRFMWRRSERKSMTQQSMVINALEGYGRKSRTMRKLRRRSWLEAQLEHSFYSSSISVVDDKIILKCRS